MSGFVALSSVHCWPDRVDLYCLLCTVGLHLLCTTVLLHTKQMLFVENVFHF